MTDVQFRCDIEAAKGDKTKIRSLVYSGGLMSTAGGGPTVVDLAGMEAPPSVVILDGHDNSLGAVIGSGQPKIENNTLTLTGTISDKTEAGQRVIALLRDGVPLQSSLGAESLDRRFVYPGETLEANGQTFTAEQTINFFQKTRLREVSVVAIGADHSTTVDLAAKGKTTTMSQDQDLDARRKLLAAEEQRVDGIRASYAQHPQYPGDLNADYFDELGIPHIRDAAGLKAHAIETGWTQDKFELELRRASMPSVGRAAVHSGTPVMNDELIEAALAKHLGAPVDGYPEQTQEQSQLLGITSVMDAVKCLLQSNGQYKTTGSKPELLKAAFNTTHFTSLLANISNKSIAQAYLQFPSVARTIARKLTANDFKTHTGIQIDGHDSKFEEISADGELKYKPITERTFTYAVNTYGRMVGLTRRDLINDDLQIFSEIPQLIGRGAGQALEKLFWELVIANTSNWFHADNGNLITGAATALSVDATGTAAKAMFEQTDANSDPIAVSPKYLVVPPALWQAANQIYNSSEVVAGPSSSTDTDTVPSGNPWFKSFVPLVAPWIGASGLSGGSDAYWYLFSDPVVLGCFGIGYLDGVELPVVEEVPQESDKLGVSFRGYMDFGVCQVDAKGGVRSNGA